MEKKGYPLELCLKKRIHSIFGCFTYSGLVLVLVKSYGTKTVAFHNQTSCEEKAFWGIHLDNDCLVQVPKNRTAMQRNHRYCHSSCVECCTWVVVQLHCCAEHSEVTVDKTGKDLGKTSWMAQVRSTAPYREVGIKVVLY